MHLRFIYIVYLALKKQTDKDMFSNDLLKPLISFLLTNIHKFRIILDSKESYYISIPKNLPSAVPPISADFKLSKIDTFKKRQPRDHT